MSLVTRCPSCATTFRVLPAQLAAREGRVRCGKCAIVFDGVNNLLTDEAIAELPVEPSPQMGLFEVREKAESAPVVSEDPLPERAVEVAPLPDEAPDHSSGAPTPDETTENEVTVAVPDAAASVPTFLAPVRPRPSRVAVWAVFATVAACGLLLQAALAFRTEIAVLLPAARPQIEAACGMLGCDVKLPRRADLMSIESSDLQADTQRQGVIVLNALLRNRAPFAQEYPDLELTLTDQSDQPLVRRVLRPGDYLQEKRAAIGPGLGGGAEEAVRVHLETGGLLATGYQLFLFYPCPPPPRSAFWQLGYPARCQTPRNK